MLHARMTQGLTEHAQNYKQCGAGRKPFHNTFHWHSAYIVHWHMIEVCIIYVS